MTTFIIVGGVLLLAVGLVASQLFRLKDWLNRQPALPPADPDDPDHPESTAQHLVSPRRVTAPTETVDVFAHILGDLEIRR